MAKKFLKLDGDKLSQVLEFKDGQRIEVPLNKMVAFIGTKIR